MYHYKLSRLTHTVATVAKHNHMIIVLHDYNSSSVSQIANLNTHNKIFSNMHKWLRKEVARDIKFNNKYNVN